MRKSRPDLNSKNKKQLKPKKKITTKDIICLVLIVLVCSALLLSIGAKFIHFYKEHFK